MKASNLKIFTIVSSIWGIALGLFGPFYVLYVQDIGGSVENLGIAFGISVIAQSLTSYFVGGFSDRFGRKPILIAVGYLNTLVLLAYTMICSVTQLYILQAVWGIVDAMDAVVSRTFLADITKKHKRGRQIGLFQTLVGFSRGVALMVGGLLVGLYGLKTIFYVCAVFYALSTTLLFSLNETRKIKRRAHSKRRIKLKNI